MILPCSKKTGWLIFSAVLLSLIANIVACKKIPTTEPPLVSPGGDTTITHITHDLSAKVTSSISGFVIDEYNSPIIGATVNAGGNSTITDKYGFFEIANVQVVREAAMIAVEKNGFLKGVKTWVAKEGGDAFFRIRLLLKTVAGNIDAAIGGNVALPSGLKIDIPANAVVDAVTKANYSGAITVSARWINPEDNELALNMPGDLRGLDSAGKIKLLATYGMAAVELRGSGGELLQIANGKKATLSIPMSASMAAKAPAKIPLWYLDETNGLWKQEGFATKTGNNYTGDVSHFSFWNCDIPDSYIHFDCRIVNAAGQPVQNALVKISKVSDSTFAGYGFTGASGYLQGAIPDNSQLLLQVFTSINCANPVAVKNFTTTSTDFSLGDLTISNQSVPVNAVVKGTVTDCNGAPVTNGYIIVAKDYERYRYVLDNNGAFNFNTTVCDPSYTTPITIIAEDMGGARTGDIHTYYLYTGDNNLGNISTCGSDTRIQFSCVLVNALGTPIPNIWAKITETANTFNPIWSYSDSSGMASDKIKPNTDYTLEVYGTRNCGTLLFSKSFTSPGSNISLGNLAIGEVSMATVTGSVTDCGGNAITNGYLIVQKSNHDIRIPVNSNGTFSFTTPVCNNTGNTPILFVSIDNNGQQSGINIPLVVNEGNNNAGILKACTDIASTTEFIKYSFNGKDFSFTSPTDSFIHYHNSPAYGYDSFTAFDKLLANSYLFHFAFSSTIDRIVVGDTSVYLDELSFPPNMDRYSTLPLIAKVYFTEVGAVGGYVAGGFTAEVHLFPSVTNADPVYEVSCSFRIKRSQ